MADNLDTYSKCPLCLNEQFYLYKFLSDRFNLEFITIHETNNFLVIRFEDAVAQPEQTIEEICNKLGIGFDKYPVKEIHNLPVKGSSELKKDGKMTWKAIEKPKKFNPVGRWKDEQIIRDLCQGLEHVSLVKVKWMLLGKTV